MADGKPLRDYVEYYCRECDCRVLYIGNPSKAHGKPACHKCGETRNVVSVSGVNIVTGVIPRRIKELPPSTQALFHDTGCMSFS